jgi:HAD superfamily hydrolase (TIGR01509 family)
MLRAIIFDMDDTLIDWSAVGRSWIRLGPDHLASLYAYLRQTGVTLPKIADFAQTYNRVSRRLWDQTGPPGWTAPTHRQMLQVTLEEHGIPAGQIDLDYAQELLDWDLVPGVTALPGADTVLRELRAACLRTGVLTNTSKPIWMRDIELRAVGLLDYLDVRMTAGDIGKLKPHPDPFYAILDRIGVNPEEAVFVGDSVTHDIAGAQGVGMRTVWKRHDRAIYDKTIRPDATIDNLGDLMEVLDGWYPGWRTH